MKVKIGYLLLVTGLLLSGCQKSGQLGTGRDEHNQINVTSTYPYELQTKLAEPLVTEPQQTAAAVEPALNKPNNSKVASVDTATTVTPAPVITTPKTTELSKWQPNEVHLIRGNELISGLQRELGRKPNIDEMRKRVQSHMGLSAAQAQNLVEVLSRG